ncbi:hypothetical protein [Silvimonas soli]|uniref:hypothetical protein n=1 Tax=Silvimonas soli TaxID=2980100 RepID=UPI0024B3A94D|nr:hypothetical protein [Silvimonas soli]
MTQLVSPSRQPMPNPLLTARPVVKFLRYAYRYSHGADMRHNAPIWPYVKLQRDARGRLTGCTVRGATQPALVNLDTLPRDASGPCHLILSGPSVAGIDYNQLSLPHAMGVNGSIALRERYPQLRFDYYAMLDAGFVRKRQHLVRQILGEDLLLFVTPEVLRWIVHLFEPAQIVCRIAVFEEVHQRVGLRKPTPEQLEAEFKDDTELVLFDAWNEVHAHGFSFDITRGLFGGGTVAYSALQFLVWLGYREIYIHGLDLSEANTTPRFYETAGKQLGSALSRQFVGHIQPAFSDAAALLKARNVQVYNLSLDSALSEDIFPKLDWHTLIPSSLAPRSES